MSIHSAVIVFGPQGCGKTRNARALADHFGMLRVIDEWSVGDPMPEDTLLLTNDSNAPGAVDYFAAMREIGPA